MTDSHAPAHHDHHHGPRRRIDGAIALILALLAGVALLTPSQLWPTLEFAATALAHTAPFLVFAILSVATLKATGAETLMARAFEGNEVRMIVLAAVAGGLAPFCSCEVIPFIAALLAVGVPLSAVMAFWLSSPLMDPAMFLMTSATLGTDFALAKLAATIGIALFGGFGVKALGRSGLFTDPLKAPAVKTAGCGTSCCGSATPKASAPVWRFWREPARRQLFTDTALQNAFFLAKWLFLAYLVEALMLRHVPADKIAALLGGDGVWTIVGAAALGGPAYLNGYAALPLVDTLIRQGMAPGAGMAFILAGGVSCIPAAIAVWALVKPRVFAAYLGFAFAGSVVAGLAWNAIA